MAKNQSREILVLDRLKIKNIDRPELNVNLRVKAGETVVVRGSSGSGKSSLLRAIDSNVSGGIVRASGVRREYVSTTATQNNGEIDMTIREFFLKSRGLDTLIQEKETIENAMSRGDKSKRTMDRYSRVLDEYQLAGGYEAEAEIEETIQGLGITGQGNRPITGEVRLGEVSSGQRTKLMIGRALFSKAELVLLDDPTAHLDQSAVDWLGNRISRQTNKAVIIASNDERLAQRNASKIVQLEDNGRVITFSGSLSNFEKKRQAQIEAEERERQALTRKKEKLESTYRRFKDEGAFKRSKDFAAVGRSMQTRLKKMEDNLGSMPIPETRSGKVQPLRIDGAKERISDSSISIRGVTRSYRGSGGVDTSKLEEVKLRRGDRLVVRGENGAGKSTLLKMIASEVGGDHTFRPERGEIVTNSNQRVAYYNSGETQTDPGKTVLETVISSMDSANEGRATAILASMGFNTRNIRKQRAGSLSNGEQQQLRMAQLIASEPDVLILDEPTSNMRPEIKKRLAKAVKEFRGITIVVDHDPEFVKQIEANKTLDLPSSRRRGRT